MLVAERYGTTGVRQRQGRSQGASAGHKSVCASSDGCDTVACMQTVVLASCRVRESSDCVSCCMRGACAGCSKAMVLF